jgi:hypothetical protein
VRIVSLIVIVILWPILLLCEKPTDARIFGAVTVPHDPPLKVNGATIIFHSHDGTEVRAVTNSEGRYETFLETGKEYDVTMSSMGMYTMHRPTFKPAAGVNLKFDFLTAPAANIDVFTNNPSHLHPSETLPYRDEETVAIGKRPTESLIIAFGILKREKSRRTYKALPVDGYPKASLPVTISFDTYTIHAAKATLDKNSRVLEAEGNVVITDGSDSPPKLLNCMQLRLGDQRPRPRQCRP